jgi:hypothetical protein
MNQSTSGAHSVALGVFDPAETPAATVDKPSDLRSSARDMRAYHNTILLRGVLTFAAMALCAWGYLPIWSLWLANLVLYPEVYLRVHDIGHGASPRSYGWVARFVPTANPIWGGTRVFASIHQEHHKYLGTNRDPWQPYYLGHPLRALFFNFIEPEYSCYQFIKRYGIDRELCLNFAWNVVAIGLGVAAFHGVYLIHILSQRVVHACGIFFFNFYTHRDTLSASASVGTWERERELRAALPLLRVIWGRDTIDGLVFHNRHHCIGQQHVPVKHYKHLEDTGHFTHFHSQWPIHRIRDL